MVSLAEPVIYEFRLVGLMPLLMHADDIEQADTLDRYRKDPANRDSSKAGDDRSPPWTWMTYLYSDGEHVTMPSDSLMVALRQAGAQIVMKKQKTFKEASQSGLLILDDQMPLLVPRSHTTGPIPLASLEALRSRSFSEMAAGVKEQGFRLFAKRARIGQAKHIRVRPRFDNWSISGRVKVTKPEITEEILSQLFAIAGSIGLGDWRPGCKTPGPFGQFEATVTKVK